MSRVKTLIVKTANVVTWIAMGACYAQILQLVLSHLASHFPQMLSTIEKILLTGTSAAVAIAVVLTFNRLVTRQSMLGLGAFCGLMAFVYFYVVRPWPNLSTAILSVLSLSYSLFALLAFTTAPVLAGALWHRRQKLSGFHLLLEPSRRQS